MKDPAVVYDEQIAGSQLEPQRPLRKESQVLHVGMYVRWVRADNNTMQKEAWALYSKLLSTKATGIQPNVGLGSI